MKTHRIDKKNRRIRKKLYLGEFAVYGFELSCQTKLKSYWTGEWDAFVDDFLEYIEGMQLCFGGGGLCTFAGFVWPFPRYGSVTKEQRDKIAKWLHARDEIIDVIAGDLVDANNYGSPSKEQQKIEREFRTKVSDYFEVVALLNQQFEDWHTNMVNISVYLDAVERDFTPEQVSEQIGVNEKRIENFLVVDTWLNNRLHHLIGKREYKEWTVRETSVRVTFPGGSKEHFTAERIASHICTSHLDKDDADWMFEDLLDSWNEMLLE